MLQLPTDFSTSTTPTRETVENYIHYAQSYIDYKTHKSWRPNLILNEPHEFGMNGFKLKRLYPTQILRLQIWNGASFETKTEGRTHDYFLVADLGMVYFARYFLLPARFQGFMVPYWQWGLGEFNFAINIDYIYGNSIDDAREGWLVQDICKKIAARDIITSHDYSILAVSGSDKVSLDRKIDQWQIQIDEQLDSLVSWQVF